MNKDTVATLFNRRLMGSETDAAHLRTVLRELGDQDKILDLLQNVLRDANWIDEIANRSYRHENGFFKIVLLASDAPSFKLRLHVWPLVQERPPAENIHNHRWNFASRILHGGYQFELFQLAEKGSAFHTYHYTSPEGGERYKMQSAGIAGAERIFVTEMSAGCCYSLDHSVLHRISQHKKGPTATLILQSGVQQSSTLVLAQAPTVSAELPAIRLDPEEVGLYIAQVCSWI